MVEPDRLSSLPENSFEFQPERPEPAFVALPLPPAIEARFPHIQAQFQFNDSYLDKMQKLAEQGYSNGRFVALVKEKLARRQLKLDQEAQEFQHYHELLAYHAEHPMSAYQAVRLKFGMR